MKYIHDFFSWVGGFLGDHLWATSMALVATVLAIYGSNISAAIKQSVQGLNVVFRLLIFIAVCAFGYGAATVLLAKLVEMLLADLSRINLLIVVTGFFVIVGILAERNNKI